MNNRIRELANKCWDERLDGRHFDREMFAELIVQECISAVEDTNDRHRRDYFAAKIREHFGIQE
jgi:hypothetical protein